ncbi:hypothetical protein Dsin_022797 [Dipteronia sinensis]|uniref:Uncharacterized protein n=1 Tax=Dipteronia sinensis TaxID=43782 RepID=A0AAE0A319_9ROSI|nr:hypothetical protein Dsin_022797 [Dipteronia sinensis]
MYAYVPRDYCDNDGIGLCGAYGNCIITDSPICQCLKGFKPKSAENSEWSQEFRCYINKNWWNSAANSTKEAKSSVVLQLLNSGNLVLRDEQSGGLGRYLCQSFDYPLETLLPEMKNGWDLKTSLERRLSSWKSLDDPSPGDFIWGVQRQGNPEIVMWKGSNMFFSSGLWNGLGFSGALTLMPNPVIELNFVYNEDEL